MPRFSQIGCPQLLAPGTLSQTMTLKSLQQVVTDSNFMKCNLVLLMAVLFCIEATGYILIFSLTIYNIGPAKIIHKL